MSEGYSGQPADQFMSIDQAKENYQLSTREALNNTNVVAQLRERSVATITMSVVKSDFNLY